MKRSFKYSVVAIFLLLVFNGIPMQAHKKEQKVKKAILLVVFGTTIPEANASYVNIEEEYRKAFPNEEIRWAYTSKMIRTKLKKNGKSIDSPPEALAKLGEEGYTHVTVQSLHVIPGEEYHHLITTAYRFNHMPKNIWSARVAGPLLSTHQDMLAVAKNLVQNLPAARKKNEAVVFMGHGTHHGANIYYPGMQYYLWNLDKNIFVGTVEGAPSLEDVTEQLKKNKIKKVWLIPLMAVAGDHAVNDMASDEPDSWKSILKKEGYHVQAFLKGMAEYDDIVSVWIKHTKEEHQKK